MPSPDYDRDHQATRTMTLLMSQLARRKNIAVKDYSESMTSAERRMLRIQDAMAHVAVREHDVCSLATNIGWDDAELRIICCVSDPSVDKHSARDTVSDGASSFSFKNLVVYLTRNWNTSNDSKNDPEVGVPTLLTIMKPEHVGAVDALKYFEILNGSRPVISLENHIWLIANALINPDKDKQCDEEFAQRLFRNLTLYIASYSFPKMNRRVHNTRLSIPMFNNFQCIDIEKIPSPSRSPLVNLTPTEKIEITNDRAFLLDFMQLCRQKFDIDPGNYPSMTELAGRVKPEDDVVELYTDNTKKEFHTFVVTLFKQFSTTLEDMKSDNSVIPFATLARQLSRSGVALQRLSRGRALRLHLENIVSLLPPPSPYLTLPTGTEDEEEYLGMIGTTASASYLAWFQLMISHFDAVDILVSYATSPVFRCSSVEIKVLHVPPPQQTLLPWKDLFTLGYIPAQGSSQAMGQSTVENKDILTFLDIGSKSAIMSTYVKPKLSSAAAALQGQSPMTKITFAIELIDEVAAKVPDEQKAVLEKQAKLLRHGTASAKLKDVSKCLDSISAKYPAASEGSHFLAGLESLTFTGTVHCEVCIATILPAFIRTLTPEELEAYKESNIDIQNPEEFQPTIGVSKLCCPSCSTFFSVCGNPDMLQINGEAPGETKSEKIKRLGSIRWMIAQFMENGKKEKKAKQIQAVKFLVRGSHGAISAWSLPPWTPHRIVQSVNAILGLQLRQDLLAFMEDAERSARDRTKSNGSSALSIQSQVRVRGFAIPFREPEDVDEPGSNNLTGIGDTT